MFLQTGLMGSWIIGEWSPEAVQPHAASRVGMEGGREVRVRTTQALRNLDGLDG